MGLTKLGYTLHLDEIRSLGQQTGFDASEILTINVETIEPLIPQLLRYVEFLAPTCNLIRSPRVPYSR